MARDRPPGRAIAWAVVALAVLGPTGRALAAPGAPAPADAPAAGAPLDLVVNAGPPRPVRAVLRGEDVLVPVDDLAAAGLRGLAGKRETIDGREHVSLSSLEPSLRFDVDERALALRVTAGPELLGRESLDLRSTRRPPGLAVEGDPSAFLNYSVRTTTDRRTTGFAEAGASRDGKLLYGSGQLLADGTAVRGLTSLTLDDVDSLRRLVLGDAFASSGGLGGGLLLGGVSLVREYGLDPYVVRSPAPRISGFASTPSVLDVYVNGVLVRQVPLAPGGYDVTNLPVTTGAGNVRTVLRDAFGRTETLDWRYYYSAGTLARGLSDYGYSLGFRRQSYGQASFDYGRPVLVSRHRVGVLDALTLGGRLDAAEDLVSGGPSASLGLPFGSLDLEAAASAQGGATGLAASAGYGFVSPRVSGGALLRVMSPRYANAALRAEDDRALVQATLYAGASVTSRVGVGVNYALGDRRDAGFSDVLSVHADVLLAPNLTLGLTGSRSRTPDAAPGLDAMATLAWAFAPASVADVSAQGGASGSGVSAGAQRGLPAGTGYGYRARTGEGPAGQSATGVVQYQWDYGRYEVEWDRTRPPGMAATDTGTATVSGGMVFVGDRLFLSRPVQDGFGLIRVGVPDVRGYAEGQEIGRTDSRGDLLVPSLLPYYGNRLAIADRDVPIAYRIGATERLAAPSWRSGAVTRFDVTPLRAIQGRLVASARGRDVPPAYGELRVAAPGGPFSSPVGGDGGFWLEGLPAGSHAGTVEWSGGRCRAVLVVPESPPFADVGEVRCEPEGVEGAPGGAGEPAPVTSPAPPAPLAPAAPAHAPVIAPAAAAVPTRPPSPPPGRAGLGPATPRCPACAVCFLAAVDRLEASRHTLSCVRDVAVMEPQLTRSEAAKACILATDFHQLCVECKDLRGARSCPAWPSSAPRRRPARR